MDNVFQVLLIILIGGLGIAARQLLVPVIAEKIKQWRAEAKKNGISMSKEELQTIQSIVYPLVESAYRLKLQGKIEDAKGRVLEIARTELKKIGINLSDEMLDEIRRACLVEFELTLNELNKQQAE